MSVVGNVSKRKDPNMLDQALDLAHGNILETAIKLYHSANIQAAVEFLKVLLLDSPEHLEGNFLMAKCCKALGADLDALPFLETCLQAAPKTIEYWELYLEIISRVGDQDAINEAISLRDSIVAEVADNNEPQNLQIENDNANRKLSKKKRSQLDQQMFEQMRSLYEKKQLQVLEVKALECIKLEVCVGFAYRFLGLVYLEDDRIYEAESAMLQSLAILPKDPIAHFNYALLCVRRHNIESAESHYRKAILLDAKFVAAYNNLGNLLREQRRYDEAERCLRKLVELAPNLEIAHFNLVNVLIQKGSSLLALKMAKQALLRFPMSAELSNAVGSLCFLLGEKEDAISPLVRAIELKPDYVDALNNLGSVYFDLKRLGEAKPLLKRVIELSPNLGSAYRSLGQIAHDFDRDLVSAIEFTRQALKCDPEDRVANNGLLFMLSEYEGTTAEELFREHKMFGDRMELHTRPKWLPHNNSKVKARKLKLGFVSGDFYNHAVVSFIEPILLELAKRDDAELFAYYSNHVEDETTERFKSFITNWREIEDLNDDDVAERIRNDRIDILVDLSGHTSHNRLPLFALKPAPIAVTWIGYPGTTGLSSIDYFIADRFYVPYGRFDHFFTEKLAYIPCTSTFQMENDAPDIDSLPALANKYLTFGSFNRISKINASTVETWTRLLRAVPDSRLLLGCMPSDSDLTDFLDSFVKFGIDRRRIDLFGRTRIRDYLAAHNRVDICLDTFPYNGGTTIHHALSMGVPTLSIDGQTIPARSSAAILGQVGLDSFLAKDADDFVQRGVYWSKNLETLAELRSNLRQICSNSIKSKPDLLASYLSRAFRTMWEKWCDGEGASTFLVEE